MTIDFGEHDFIRDISHGVDGVLGYCHFDAAIANDDNGHRLVGLSVETLCNLLDSGGAQPLTVARLQESFRKDCTGFKTAVPAADVQEIVDVKQLPCPEALGATANVHFFEIDQPNIPVSVDDEVFGLHVVVADIQIDERLPDFCDLLGEVT
jgi:hypothetical protein